MKAFDRREFLKKTAKGFAVATTLALSPEQMIGGTLGKVVRGGSNTDMDTTAGIPDFKFNNSGKFKVMQIADTHFVGVHENHEGRLRMATQEFAEEALRNITSMLEEEKPDLVIHTGDIIYSAPAKENLKYILSPMAKLHIPFAVTLGNHDEEFGLTRQEVFDYVRTLPSNINTPSIPGIHNCSNNIITLSTKDNKLKRVFYLLDSGRKFAEKPTCYDFIRHDQIEWYCKKSEYFKQQNGGENVPGMMFMHIPVREYKDGLRDTKRILRGNFGEEPGSSLYNSGLFSATVERGDIDAFVFGHDHDSDCALMYMNKFLIYGRFSGYNSVYNNLKPGGVRLFEFSEKEAGFRSWIRLFTKEKQQDYHYPEGFKSSLF